MSKIVTLAWWTGLVVVVSMTMGSPAEAQVAVSAIVDSGWGSGGEAVSDLGGHESFQDLAALPDGTLVAVGSAATETAFLVSRFTAAGAHDTGFGGTGNVTTAMSGDSVVAYAVATQEDGKIVAAGTSGNYGATSITLVRYLSTGALDTSFDGDGIVTTTVTPASHNWSADVAIQADGKIVEVGTVWNATYDIVLARYLSNGSLDSSFGSSGVVTLDIAGDWDFGYGMALQADGKIVVVGRTRVAGQYGAVIARLLTDGSLDASFGSSGTVITTHAQAASLGAVVISPSDGALLAAGYNGNGEAVVLRLLAAGTLDPGFDGDGVATTAGLGMSMSASDLKLLVDGRVVAVGTSSDQSYHQDIAVVCFMPNGVLDTGFDTDGVLVLDLGGTYDEGAAVATQRNGRLLLAGVADNAMSYDGEVIALVGQSEELIFWDDLESGASAYWTTAVP